MHGYFLVRKRGSKKIYTINDPYTAGKQAQMTIQPNKNNLIHLL